MGVIKRKHGEEYVLLNAEHIVGRNAYAVNTYTPGTDISRIHARFKWKSEKWFLQDHSLNGTLLNKRHLHNESAAMKKGDSVKLGTSQESEWNLVDDAPPTSYFKSTQDPADIRALAQKPGIPIFDHPDISIYFAPGHCWRAETAGTTIDLFNGTKVSFSDKEWTFVENEVLDITRNLGPIVEQTYFVFALSADEERIRLRLTGKAWQQDLGERSHNYLLLALARKRIQDQESAYAAPDCGWLDMEQLTRDMSKEYQKDIDEYHVNLQIHRFRKQLMALQPYGYLFTNCIERRKGEIRLAHAYFKITKELNSIYENLPVNT